MVVIEQHGGNVRIDFMLFPFGSSGIMAFAVVAFIYQEETVGCAHSDVMLPCFDNGQRFLDVRVSMLQVPVSAEDL